MRDPTERLRDILEAIAAIARYARREIADLDRDETLQVLWCGAARRARAELRPKIETLLKRLEERGYGG